MVQCTLPHTHRLVRETQIVQLGLELVIETRVQNGEYTVEVGQESYSDLLLLVGGVESVDIEQHLLTLVQLGRQQRQHRPQNATDHPLGVYVHTVQ